MSGMVYTEALLGFLVVYYFGRIVVRFIELGKTLAWQCRAARVFEQVWYWLAMVLNAGYIILFLVHMPNGELAPLLPAVAGASAALIRLCECWKSR